MDNNGCEEEITCVSGETLSSVEDTTGCEVYSIYSNIIFFKNKLTFFK